MKTDYDGIADQYKESKLQPWRTYIEQYTLMQLVGDIQTQSVVDFACGEGYYTRRLKARGAADVLGVDISEGMIKLAETEERRSPLGIDYVAGDACKVELPRNFDLAFAAYFTCYAANESELFSMAQAITRSLKPGGRFVTVTNDPLDSVETFTTDNHYGFVKRVAGTLADGAAIEWTFDVPDGSFTVTNYHLDKGAIENVLTRAGLCNIRWHTPELSPEGIAEKGEAYWTAFLKRPPITFLECHKK